MAFKAGSIRVAMVGGRLATWAFINPVVRLAIRAAISAISITVTVVRRFTRR
jgi:hypothetical protein